MTRPKDVIAAVVPYAKPEGRRGKLRLDLNENVRGCSPAVLKAIRGVTREDVSIYPEYSGFRELLAKELGISSEQLFLSDGADEAVRLITETYLDKGDEMVVPDPTFSMYGIYASMQGAMIKSVPYGKGLEFPLEGMIATISSETKLIIFANSNNPTGTAIGLEAIERLLKAAKDSLVVVDEAYFEFCGITALGLLPRYENLIILRTFSKAYGIAGLRLGYAVASPAIIDALLKCASPFSVNSLAVIAGGAALKDKGYLAKCIGEVKQGREYLRMELGGLGVPSYPSQANFVIARVGPGSKDVVSKLKDRGILIKEMGGPLLGGCIRIGVGSPADCKRVVKEMSRLLGGAKAKKGDCQ